MAELLSREPWWEKPPRRGQNELECSWVWIEFYSDGKMRIDNTRPTDDEIRSRPSCRLPESMRPE